MFALCKSQSHSSFWAYKLEKIANNFLLGTAGARQNTRRFVFDGRLSTITQMNYFLGATGLGGALGCKGG